MDLFNVYPLFDIEPVKASGCQVTDANGIEYLDLYGGHAVISIGHTHPHYVQKISSQLQNIGFYSNSVQIKQQKELAQKLGELSGYEDWHLFLCNSGAEANENALKLASFYNGRKKVISFKRGFHGRTSAAVAITDNPNIVAPINANHEVEILPFNDIEAFKSAVSDEVCAVIVEGIQGIGGIHVPSADFLEEIQCICNEKNIVLILDEIQSGYGRSGKFFAHQYSKVEPDVITIAKGMGNGFPVGGVLIHPKFKASFGMLGTTFGGNHLACAASIAVLDVMKSEELVGNSSIVGDYLKSELEKIKGIKEVRGKGLMIGIEFENPIKEIRSELLFKHHIFTGVSGQFIIRLLPPLSITMKEANQFLKAFKAVLSK